MFLRSSENDIKLTTLRKREGNLPQSIPFNEQMTENFLNFI
jgi:hypothetical protein